MGSCYSSILVLYEAWVAVLLISRTVLFQSSVEHLKALILLWSSLRLVKSVALHILEDGSDLRKILFEVLGVHTLS